MIAARCVAGIFAGTVVTVRAMLSENSTKHTQARAFSYFAFSRNIGLLIGPPLGQYIWKQMQFLLTVCLQVVSWNDQPQSTLALLGGYNSSTTTHMRYRVFLLR
jgi:MFS family permease